MKLKYKCIKCSDEKLPKNEGRCCICYNNTYLMLGYYISEEAKKINKKKTKKEK